MSDDKKQYVFEGSTYPGDERNCGVTFTMSRGLAWRVVNSLLAQLQNDDIPTQVYIEGQLSEYVEGKE